MIGSAAPVNVALNKTVTLEGVFGNSTAGTPIVWSDPAPPAPSSVVDGVFLAEGQDWQQGLWWHEYQAPRKSFVHIDLGAAYQLVGAVVQADNNEPYFMEYLDVNNVWQSLWTVPQSSGFGVKTRPNTSDTGEIHMFDAPVSASKIRLSGGQGNDVYYSISEVQVFASQAVPEPSTAVLGLAGLTIIAGSGLRRRRRS